MENGMPLQICENHCRCPHNQSSSTSHCQLQTAREAFRIIDENGDGFLQKEEVVRAIEMMVEHGEMDLDGMTSIELAEKMMSEVDIE